MEVMRLTVCCAHVSKSVFASYALSAMLKPYGSQEEDVPEGDGGEGAVAQGAGDDSADTHRAGEEEREDGKAQANTGRDA